MADKKSKKPAKKKAGKRKSTKQVIEKARAMKELERELDKLNASLTPLQRKAARQLSPKNLIFSNLRLRGISQRAAYLESRPDSEATIKTLDENASVTAKLPEVVIYMDVMKTAAVIASGYERTWKRDTLIEIVERSMALDPEVSELHVMVLEGQVRRELEQRLTEPAPETGKGQKKATPIPAGMTIEIPVSVVPSMPYDGKQAISAISEMNRMDGDHRDNSVLIIEETQAERLRRLSQGSQENAA